MSEINPLDIAVIGMSCYFPEADNTEEFWNNLSKGICSVKFYSDKELMERGVDKKMLNHPDYVKASPYFSRTRLFDASFFNINPGEANIMDPQRRLFIENCWQALEDAGYVPEKYEGKIGVFGSTGINFYMMNLLSKIELVRKIGALQLISSNDKDGLPTQTSYLLNLTGPSVNINTACSSTLVAIHLARQSLLLGDADMALVGGAAVIIPENIGYLHEKDNILSHDGYCRAFDNSSDGTIWGSGSGVVLLKRLGDAIEDGDNIRAVLKGSAVNNDGSEKVGYTAPSIEGQSEVIVQAYSSSEIDPRSIQYIETHGTGTKIGDPIEVASLTRAFNEFTGDKQFCGIGSVKTNFGHLGAAAGIASFIKAVLALEHKQIPPSLHFKEGNKSIKFEDSPFYVNTVLSDMKEGEFPLRVGVSSLGVGGTNAHLILEEAPEEYRRTPPAREVALVLSARTGEQLDESRKKLLAYLKKNPSLSLVNMAYTLQAGRRDFRKKMAVKASNIDEAVSALETGGITDENYTGLLKEDLLLDKKLMNWFNGTNPGWDELYRDIKPGRVNLPVYPFAGDTFWIDSGTPVTAEQVEAAPGGKRPDPAEWFYRSVWSQDLLPSARETREKQTWLIFADKAHWGREVGRELTRLGDQVLYIYPGKKWASPGGGCFEIDVKDPGSYDTLVKTLAQENRLPDRILHMWALNRAPVKGYLRELKGIFDFQDYGLFSFVHLVKAFNSNNITKEMRIITLGNNIYDITGEEPLQPEKSTLLSAMKVIQQEYLNFSNRLIEVDGEFLKNSHRTEFLVNEILSESKDVLCSYRGQKRWIKGYQPVQVASNGKSAFREKGVYFVFGGLTGGMPFFYEYLMEKYQARLILVDDPFFTKEKDWDQWLESHDPNEINSLKIKSIKKLKALGVEYIDGIDIFYQKKKLEKRILELEQKLGPIRGVIHAAGGYAAGRIAPLTISGDNLLKLAQYNIASIGGSFMAVNDIFKKRDLDFRYLWTSLSTVLAGPTFISYCAADSIASQAAEAANRYLDVPWSVFNWDSLEAEWFEDLVEENMAMGYQLLHERIEEGLITTEEGFRCMEMLTGQGRIFNPMIISCSDLLLRYNTWVKMEQVRTKKDTASLAENMKPRPELSTVYEAPVNDLEKKITAVMEEILCISPIGRKDNFFDLGGNSLVAIQLSSKIREFAPVDFGMDKLFDNQTIAEIAVYIDEVKK